MMIKHVATLSGAGLAAAFVVVFFAARPTPRALGDLAPSLGMSDTELLAIGPRVASQTGATLGSSRRVVYLLACSGLATRETLEAQAAQAGARVVKDRLTDREAVAAVLGHGGPERLKDC